MAAYCWSSKAFEPTVFRAHNTESPPVVRSGPRTSAAIAQGNRARDGSQDLHGRCFWGFRGAQEVAKGNAKSSASPAGAYTKALQALESLGDSNESIALGEIHIWFMP